MRTPNFFIVGAPKCGTTALYKYLSAHPNVFMPTWEKEPHFFASDFPRFRRIRSVEDYLGLFRECREEHAAVGEASVFYLYSQVALQDLRDFQPDAKVVAMVRNPVDMVYSLHSQYLLVFQESEPDFEVAWQLQPERQRGCRIPPTCRAPELLQYGRVGMLGSQVERLLGLFPPERVKIIFFDDLAASPAGVYRDTLEFLGLPDDGRREFRQVNASKTNRWPRLSRLIMLPPFPLNLARWAVKKCLGARSHALGLKVRLTLTRREKRPPMPPELRRELAGYFRDDIRQLETLTGRDLSRWWKQ